MRNEKANGPEGADGKKSGEVVMCPGCGLEFERNGGKNKVTVQQALDQLGRDLGKEMAGKEGIRYKFGEESGFSREFVLELDDVGGDGDTIEFRMVILEPVENDKYWKTHDAREELAAVAEYILGDIKATFRYLRDIHVQFDLEFTTEVSQ